MGSISYMESLLKFSKYLVKQKVSVVRIKSPSISFSSLSVQHYVKAAENLQKMLTIHSLSELDQVMGYLY